MTLEFGIPNSSIHLNTSFILPSFISCERIITDFPWRRLKRSVKNFEIVHKSYFNILSSFGQIFRCLITEIFVSILKNLCCDLWVVNIGLDLWSNISSDLYITLLFGIHRRMKIIIHVIIHTTFEMCGKRLDLVTWHKIYLNLSAESKNIY